MSWQTQIFCSSALHAYGEIPIVIVHEDGSPLRDEYRMLIDLGARVEIVPSYTRSAMCTNYPPRNELGSLKYLSEMQDIGCDNILFCEPDMLFVKPLKFGDNPAAEYYSYIDYHEPRVLEVLEKYKISHLVAQMNITHKMGVPYFLPVSSLRPLADRWIEVLDSFSKLHWIDIMYAFGIAAVLENVSFDIMHQMTSNHRSTAPLRGLIHYCLGDATWNKRDFKNTTPLMMTDQQLSAGLPSTVLGEIMSQIREAKGLFS